MLKKRINVGIVFSIIVLLSVIFVSAVDNSTNGSISISSNSESGKIDKAYQCLEEIVKDNDKLSLQEAIFSGLALGAKTNILNKIEDEKGTNCWPKAGCKLKESSQVALAYNKMGKNTEEIEKWILSKNSSTSDLVWHLQIDISNHIASQCTIRYDGRENKIKVREDMRLEGNAGSCLSLSSSGYWFKISESCLSKEFEISCDQDFITSLLYKKTTGETIFVSSETHSASSLGTTKETVKARCFKTGSSCDYEGSLWAVLALSKTGNDVSSFVPYLLALSEDNRKYFPSSIIHIVTGGEDQYSDIVQSQKQNKYWEMTSTPNNRFYDTSLGMLSLQSTSAMELENAMNYLMGIQSTTGCWNNDNIRDTAFVLYSGWPKAGVSSGESSGSTLCTSASQLYSCSRANECIEAGGQILYNFECTSSNQFCCSIKPLEQTCKEKNGLICGSDQRCSDATVSSADGSCCLGACQNVQVENSCEDVFEGECKSSCSTGEEEISASCGESSGVCCVLKQEETGSLIWIWITLLILLIILITLGIIYRDKIRLWWFQFRGKFKSGPVNRSGPSPPSSGNDYGYRAMPPRAFPIRTASQPIRRPMPSRPAPKDREMEETFKKLRDMSK